MTGLPANSFIKGGMGESAGDTDKIHKGHHGASGIQKMKSPAGGERGY
jgi:hypothetical protein